MMTLAEAVDIVIGRTKHQRFRVLCDKNHVDYNPEYIPVVLKMANEEWPPKSEPIKQDIPSVSDSLAAIKAMKACRFRSVSPGCGCSGAKCGLRNGGIVGYQDCFACIIKYEIKTTTRDLVVCRYTEDVRWLDKIPHEFDVTIYNKSALLLPVANRPYHIHQLENVGREAHSMLSHIVANYSRLADWTYFCQGDALEHAPDFIGRLSVNYEDTCSLTDTYSNTHPPDHMHKFDKIEYHGGYRVRYGDAMIPLGISGRPSFSNPAGWNTVFACPRPDPIRFGYAAMYAVPRHRIRARPLGFWKWLLDLSAKSPWAIDEWTDPPMNPWQFETMWLALFSSPDMYPHKETYLEST